MLKVQTMGIKSKKYYYNQILDNYIYSKKLLGMTCKTKHVFKNKIEFFDGYLRFAFDENISQDKRKKLTKLNDEFDALWDKYHKKKCNFISATNEIKMDRKNHVFYLILIFIALCLNIVFILNSFFNSSLIIFLGTALFVIPLFIYIYKIIANNNQEKIINKKREKTIYQLSFIRNQIIDCLYKSPYSDEADFSSYLIDYKTI